MKPLFSLLFTALCLSSCVFNGHHPLTRDLYCGEYQLDIKGSVELVGLDGTPYQGMTQELTFDEKATHFSLHEHHDADDRVVSEGFWSGMPGTIVETGNGEHYLLFDEKVLTQDEFSGGTTYSYTFTLHNGPAHLSDGNKELSWTTDMHVEVFVKQELVFSGNGPVNNHAIRK